jgi:F420H(2)-dependent quinone reductase
MSRVTRPSLRDSWLGPILRLWNPIMTGILRSPVHRPLSRWFMVLGWTGRRSGRRYSTPVSYLRDGSTLFVTSGDRWWRNVEGGGQVAIRLEGRSFDATATPITDPERSWAEHARLFRGHGWFRRLSGVPSDGHGGADPAALRQAVEAGRVLVRIDLP